MKKITIIILCALSLLACKKNFDEIADTDQRQITFNFDCSDIFDEILKPSGDDFSLGIPAVISDDYRLRVTAYCYDSDDSIVVSNNVLTNNFKSSSLTFSHLYKDIEYHFVFLADIVIYDQSVNFYETWFQMGTKKWEDFYVFCDTQSEADEYNVMMLNQTYKFPSNDTVCIEFEPLTCNGFIILEKANIARRLSGFISYIEFFHVKKLTGDIRRTKSFSYTRPTEENIIFPLTIGKIKDKVTVRVRVDDSHVYDSITVNFKDNADRPFVIMIDCDSLTKEIKTY